MKRRELLKTAESSVPHAPHVRNFLDSTKSRQRPLAVGTYRDPWRPKGLRS